MTAHQGPSSLNNPPWPVDTQSVSLEQTSHHQTMSSAMTVTPARPLMHAYSGDDPMEIIDYRGESWNAGARSRKKLAG